MKTSTLNTIAILATVASLVVGDFAFAKGGSSGHSGGSSHSSGSSHSNSSSAKMSSGISKMSSSLKTGSSNSGKIRSNKTSSNNSKTVSNGSNKTTGKNKSGNNNSNNTTSNGNKLSKMDSSKTVGNGKNTNGSNGNKQFKNDSGKTANNGNKGKHDGQKGDHDKHGKHDHGCFSDFFCSTYCCPSYGCCSDYGCYSPNYRESYCEPVYCQPSYCDASAPYGDSVGPAYADQTGPVVPFASGQAPVAGGDAAAVTGQFADAGQAFEPFHSTYNTLPGDSFYTVSLKEYGTSAKAGAIAQFNGMSQDAALVPGQSLVLPSIAADGALSQSSAPVAESLAAPVRNTAAANSVPATPASFTTPAGNDEEEVARTQVPAGSTLLVDGQNFGSKPGSARLRIGGGFLKLAIAQWTPNAVKVSLPKADQAGSTDADLEVVRADGSVASRTALEVSSTDQVAANN